MNVPIAYRNEVTQDSRRKGEAEEIALGFASLV
jgi:hypothetical protein